MSVYLQVEDVESIKTSAAYMLFYRRRQPTAAINVAEANAAEARADLDLAATSHSTNESLSSSPTDTATAFEDNAALPPFPAEPHADDGIHRSTSDPISAAA